MGIKFNKVSPQDVSKSFEQLSSTIRTVGQATKKFDEMEVEERKAHQAYQDDLDAIFHVQGKGLVQEDYEQLVREQNAIAQKEGHIRAYENLSYLDSVASERASIRLSAFQSEIKKSVPAMSNATLPLDYDTAEGIAYEALNAKGVLGVDSAGNEVTMSFDGQSTGEMIALSRGITKNRIVLDAAVEDMRQEEAIKSSESRYQSELHNMINMSMLVPETRDLLPEQYRKLADEYFGYGVSHINALTLNAINAKIVEKMSSPEANATTLAEVYEIIDMFEQDIEMRGEAGTFGAPGTDNYIKLEKMRSQANATYASIQRASKAQSEAVIEQVEDTILNVAISSVLDGTPVTPERVRDIKRTLGKQAQENGIYDIDKLMGQVDTFIASQEIDDTEVRVTLLDFATQSRHDVMVLEQLSKEALDQVRRGQLTASSYGVVTTKINGYIGDLENIEVATYADAKTRLDVDSTNYEQVMKNTLMLNDRKFSSFDVKRQFSTITTLNAQDNKPDVKYLRKIRTYDERLDNLAIYGGTDEQKKLEFSRTTTITNSDGTTETIEGDYEFLMRQGIPEFKIKEALALYNEKITFSGATVEGSRDEINRATQIDERVSNYAVVQGMMQMIEYKAYIAQVQATTNFGAFQ